MSIYYLKESKIDVKVIDPTDPGLQLKDSRFLNARNLKTFIQAFDACTLCVTATMPNVYFYLQVGESHSRTYNLSYRSFLAFVSQLERPEEEGLDWRVCGF